MRTTFRVALLVLCLAVLAAATWRWTRPEVEAEEHPAAAAPETPAAGTPGDITRPLPPAPSAPFATKDVAPLPADIAALVAAADSGDARAACSLGTRLVACAFADFYSDDMLERFRQQEAMAEAKGDKAQANEAAKILLQGTAIRRHCDPIPPDLRDRAFDYLRQSALAGEPEAIVRYATGQALSRRATHAYAFLRTPRFDTWRAEAPALVGALQRSGRPEAVLAMIEATTEGNHLSLITPPDPVQDAAYRLLAQRLFPSQESGRRFALPDGLSPEQQREAGLLAESWHRDDFSGGEFALDEHVAGFVLPFSTELPDGWPRPAAREPSCFDAAIRGRP